MNRNAFLAAVGAATLLLGNPAFAICKWKDANGRTQYADQPPPGVQCGNTIKVQPPSPAPTAGGAADGGAFPPSAQEKEMEFRKRRLEREEANKKSELDRANLEIKKQNCETARNRHNGLMGGGRVVRFDANGQRFFLSDQEVEAEIAEARKQADQFCR